MSKKDVPCFGPMIRFPFIFNKDSNLKKFLLSKLINAEYASLRAPAFSSFSEQTIETSLNKMYTRLSQLTLNFTWLSDQASHSSNQAKFLVNDANNNTPSGSVASTPTSTSKSGAGSFLPIRSAIRRLSVSLAKDPKKEESKEKDNESEQNVYIFFAIF